MSTPNVQVKRVYEEESPDDGTRVLVDRLWPRGVSKERADLALWEKQVAPSTDLRKRYGHDPDKFAEFKEKYIQELSGGEQEEGFQKLLALAQKGKLTLLTASKATDISEAEVLRELIAKQLK